MSEAKKRFEAVRMIVETISSEDEEHTVVRDIRASWTPYFETYKKLNRNYCNAYSFRRKRLKELEDKQKAAEAETPLKKELALKEMRLQNYVSIKKLELEHNLSLSGTASSGTSTPISRESPVPPVAAHMSKQDISQFKPTKLTLLQALIPRDAGLERRSPKLVLKLQITQTSTSACRNISSRSSWTPTCGSKRAIPSKLRTPTSR